MKTRDLPVILILVAIFAPFFLSEDLYSFYSRFNSEHGFIMSFIKFAVLATYGEILGLRIRTGSYNMKGFGLAPRMMVWGILGLAIKAAFMVYSSGAPAVLSYLGMNDPGAILTGPFSAGRVLVAFCISLFLNLTFSPVLMTFHRITDAHIARHNGRLACLVNKINVKSTLATMDWGTHWGFILKKTIPFFWIPAHTLTFLLPADFQILFAAFLGVVLGVILAFAAGSKTVD
ncbi:MAG: hypothetical protein U0X39_11960 [Bacteroidales bacterium]